MKMEFKLDAHKGELTGSTIAIIGKEPEYKTYVRIELANNNQCLFVQDKDLERFAVNILKAIKSKKLKASR